LKIRQFAFSEVTKNNFGGYMEVFSNEKGSGKSPEPLVFLGAEDEI